MQYSDGGFSEENVEIKKFLRRELVHVSPETSIRNAAALMHENGISSVLVMEGERLLGILTDSDLRHLVAENFDFDRGIAEFLEIEGGKRKPLITVESDESVLAVLSKMLENGIKHTIVTEGGRPQGIITLGDIAYELGPFYIKYIIKLQKAKGVEAIRGTMEEFKEDIRHQAMKLMAESKDVRPNFFFEAISYVVDSAAKSLTKIVGNFPDGLLYAATGSWGRREQFLITDRDTLAIYVSDDSDAFQHYVNDFENAMDLVGFPPCPHGYTARNYVFPENLLLKRITEWARHPEGNMVDISIIADARPILGDSAILERIKDFLSEKLQKDRLLIMQSLMYKPALNVFRRMARSFNFKSGAVAAIEYPIRALSITHGIVHTSTYERIRALEREGVLSQELASELLYSYSLIMRQKISLQIRSKTELKVSDLTPIERNMLENALKTVKKFQDYVERNYV